MSSVPRRRNLPKSAGVDLARGSKILVAEEIGVMIFMHQFGTSLVGRHGGSLIFPNTIGHPLDSPLCVEAMVRWLFERFPS